VSTCDNAPNISIQVTSSITEIQAEEWNALAAGRPFQSYSWYQFAEKVMLESGCRSIYLLSYRDGTLTGRASLWVVHNEPILFAGGLRIILKPVLRKFPLLICRSPFSNTSGLIAPDQETLEALIDAAIAQGRQMGCMAFLMDYLSNTDASNLPDRFYVEDVPKPGTVLVNSWESFDQYLACGNKKDRQHYKRIVRKANELGIQVRKETSAHNVDAISEMVHATERKHGSEPNPWTKGLLANMAMAGGILLVATRNEEVTGCGLLFEDNGAQLATALGHTQGNDYTYFLLAYTGVEVALAQGVKTLRWGSGAYEVKRRLGFVPEDNGKYAYVFTHPLATKFEDAIQWTRKWIN
jgi:predicted N-acyltransferase